MSFVVTSILVNVNMDLTLYEIHNLAYFYHWSRDQCWHCPCTERGVFNDHIKQQLKAENEGSSSKGASPSKSKPYKEGF